jgi:hypothetical protein
MPSAKYYFDQARTLLAWARRTQDGVYAQALRQRAGDLMERAKDAHPAVPDLNPLLSEFNDRQMQDGGAEAEDATAARRTSSRRGD